MCDKNLSSYWFFFCLIVLTSCTGCIKISHYARGFVYFFPSRSISNNSAKLKKKTPKYLWTVEWVNNSQFIMLLMQGTKVNKLYLHATLQINLGNIILSKRSHTQNNTIWFLQSSVVSKTTLTSDQLQSSGVPRAPSGLIIC